MRLDQTGARVGAAAFAVVLASSAPVAAKLSDLAPGSAAQKAAIKCVQTIQKEASKYAAAHMKLIVKCKASVIKGKGGVLAACDPLTGDLATKDAGKVEKLADKIAGKCGGQDKTCGVGVGPDADLPLADISWDIGACPALEGQSPGNAIVDCGDIADCLVPTIRFANHRVANDISADLFDDAIFGADVDPDKANNKCQRAAFKAVTKFSLAKSKVLLKCWTAKTKLKGDDFDDADPCPDTDEVGKTKASIEKLEKKMAAAICKRCGGGGDADKDGTCDTPGAVLDFLSGGPFACPQVIVPGSSGPGGVSHFYDNDGSPANGVDCLAMGDPVVDTVQEYVNCLACVAEYQADCVAHLSNGEDFALGMVIPGACQVPGECGNGVIDPGETCDIALPDPQCPGAGNGLQDCNFDCTCSCPGRATFEIDPNDPATRLDSGFSGFGHGSTLIDALVTVSLSGGTSGLPGLRDPDCGVMTVGGPLQNPAAGAGQTDVRRCSKDHSIKCSADSDCPGSETCMTYLGSRLPISAGGTSACVTNRFVAPIVGTANVETGESANTVAITSEVRIGSTLDKPCDNCIGDLVANDGSANGTCDTGDNAGLACDVNGASPIPAFNGGLPAVGTINGTSLDCPSGQVGTGNFLAIDLSNSTGSEGLTVQATGPTCTSSGYGGSTCLCDTCAGFPVQPCNADADCPGATPGSCGGRRCLSGPALGTPCTTAGTDPVCSGYCTGPGTPDLHCTGPGTGPPCGTLGEPTRPNACLGSTCTAGVCAGGPFNGFCGPVETFRGCIFSAHCPFPGDTCMFVPQPCFDDNGIVGGTISVAGAPDVPVNDTARPAVAAAFCIPPSVSSAINTAAGFPGAGRVRLVGDAKGLP